MTSYTYVANFPSEEKNVTNFPVVNHSVANYSVSNHPGTHLFTYVWTKKKSRSQQLNKNNIPSDLIPLLLIQSLVQLCGIICFLRRSSSRLGRFLPGMGKKKIFLFTRNEMRRGITYITFRSGKLILKKSINYIAYFFKFFS